MEGAIIISGIISIISLIVFFIMSKNVAEIRKNLEAIGGNSYASAYQKGELKEFQGKKDEALDYYNEAYFIILRLIRIQKNLAVYSKNKEKIEKKIVMLGGTIKT